MNHILYQNAIEVCLPATHEYLIFDQITLAWEKENTPILPPMIVVSHTQPVSTICVDPEKNFTL